MRQYSEPARSFWLTILALTFIVNAVALKNSLTRWNELGVALHSSIWGVMLLVYILTLAICLWGFLGIISSGKLLFKIPVAFIHSSNSGVFWRILAGIVFLAILFAIPYFKFTFQIGQDTKNGGLDHVLAAILYYWMCSWVLLLGMVSLKIAFDTTFQGGFVYALVILGVVYEIFIRFHAVTTYPLSMGWSEGSRYYYASLYFSQWIYGESFPLSTLHPSRYLLQALPFLISDLGITVHRFWQFLLWIGLTAGAAITLAGRVFHQEKAAQWLFAGWFFLFLLRVGVYYHLEVMVIVPLLFVSAKRPWRSLIAIIFSSIWAGISRVNWFPVPAMIAIAIYLLETPVQSKTVLTKKTFQYLSQPALWAVVGLSFALAAQVAFIPLSGNTGNVQTFASSFTSDLLWYRLWPNDNHLLGILPGALIFSSPMIITVINAAYHWKALHPIRWLGLFTMIAFLFVGSLVVSVKIGGGGDLHNMDTYAVLLSIVAGYFIAGHVQIEPGEPQLKIRSWPIITIALVTPIIFLIPLLYSYPNFDEGKNQFAHQQLTQSVNEAGKKGPVLFINERQLVTFGDVDVPLVPDYEAVTLMEMAMSDNRAYLENFYDDLSHHKFAAIVVSKQNLTIKQTGPLAEENNVWNTRVSPYIICYYDPSLLIEPDGNRIEVYVPKTISENCL